MENTLAIVIKTSDNALTGSIRASLVRWEEGQPKQSYPLFGSVTILPTIEEAGSVAQFAVTAIREAADRGVAKLLELIASGQGIPVHIVEEDKVP